MEITRYKLTLKSEDGRDLLPLHSTEQLGGLYSEFGTAVSQLEELYSNLLRYDCNGCHFDPNEGLFFMSCLGIPVIGRVEEVKIQLTGSEFDAAGREWDYNNEVEDCRHAIYAFAGYDPDTDEDSADNLSAAQSFLDKYGLSVCDLAEGAGEESEKIRDKIIAKYDHIFDANYDTNGLWEDAIRLVLYELAEKA